MSTRLAPHVKDLGGFSVRRLLPAPQLRTIGPFVFFDHLGPADFAPGEGIDVRPHPHIGLATVTYLFEGALLHRDSLGNVQRIEAGDVNWMTAGRGIVHSERSDTEDRARGHRLHGIQTWVALPDGAEETAADFAHVARARLPLIERPGVGLRLIAGEWLGERAPTPSHSPTFYLGGKFERGSRFELPPEHAERGVYLVDGSIDVDGERLAPYHLLALDPGRAAMISAHQPSTVMLFGGAPVGDRFVWWNFVSSSRERIEAAKARWVAGEMGQVPGETEFIPLPGQ